MALLLAGLPESMKSVMLDSSMMELAEPGTQPEYHFPPYVSTIARSPRLPLILLPRTQMERSGPVFGHGLIGEHDNDLTVHRTGPLRSICVLGSKISGKRGERAMVDTYGGK